MHFKFPDGAVQINIDVAGLANAFLGSVAAPAPAPPTLPQKERTQPEHLEKWCVILAPTEDLIGDSEYSSVFGTFDYLDQAEAWGEENKADGAFRSVPFMQVKQ